VQLVIGGRPARVAEPHVPWNAEDEEDEPEEEPPEDELEEEDVPELDPEPDEDDGPPSVPPDDADVPLGAVGDSSSVLFWNWQPLATIELNRRNQKDPLFIRVPYAFVRAHTIPCARRE
jgi:hypothetical protein